MTQNILLYSPDVVGHPRVYCRVIADALLDQSCWIFIAMGFSDEYPLIDCDDITPLICNEKIKIIDLREYSHTCSGSLSVEEIILLQTKLNIDTTVFIEADKSKEQFKDIARGIAPELVGRNIGIFAGTSEWLTDENSYDGSPINIIVPSFRTTLGNIKRALFNRRESAAYFFENQIIGKNILQEIWVKDERIADKVSQLVFWMPEISRAIDGVELANHKSEIHKLNQYLQTNNQLEPVLYFGDAAYYKGYDLFLKFIELNQNVCAVHAGRTYDEQQLSYFQYDVKKIRMDLINQGRLFETNEYVHSQKLKELYFSVGKIYLTTHRLTLSSSTMIQALELGIPVLVPNRGLIGHRVINNNLGLVYEYENIEDLSTKANEMWNSNLNKYTESIQQFWGRFSDETIKKFFVGRIVTNTDKRRQN